MWILVLGEILTCKSELDTTKYRYAVAILKDVNLNVDTQKYLTTPRN